jgi:hypothetical protein
MQQYSGAAGDGVDAVAANFVGQSITSFDLRLPTRTRGRVCFETIAAFEDHSDGGIQSSVAEIVTPLFDSILIASLLLSKKSRQKIMAFQNVFSVTT